MARAVTATASSKAVGNQDRVAKVNPAQASQASSHKNKRTDPESCVGGREDAGEALTGPHAGQPPSCEIRSSGVPALFSEAEGHTEGGAIGEPSPDPARSETLCTGGTSRHGKREIPQVPTELGMRVVRTRSQPVESNGGGELAGITIGRPIMSTGEETKEQTL
jgi:hypothetical protein